VANLMNAASQNLARSMRPSKLNRNQVQSMFKAPEVGRRPRFRLWVGGNGEGVSHNLA
jgi:hypothetical protein